MFSARGFSAEKESHSLRQSKAPERVPFALADRIRGIRTHGLSNAPQVRVHGDREAGSNPTLSAHPRVPGRRGGFHIRPHTRLPPGHPERSAAESNCAAAPSQTVGSPAGFAPFRQIPRLCRALRVRLRTSSSAQDDTAVQAPSVRELSRLAVTEGVYRRPVSHVHNSLHHLRWSPSLKEGGKIRRPAGSSRPAHIFSFTHLSH